MNAKDLLRKNLAHFNDVFTKYKVHFRHDQDRIVALGETYEQKEKLKDQKFLWDGKNKVWWLPQEKWMKRDFSRYFLGPFQSIKKTKIDLIQHIKSVKNTFLSELLHKLVLRGKYKKKYFNAPGAKTYHHAYKGGLAEHSLQMLENALSIVSVYDYLDLNIDLLIAASILHDIGKIECYKNTAMGISLTQYIEDFDHIILAISIVSRAAEELIQNESEEKLFEHLIQIITSHHNIKDWGSPKPPGSAEAWIIHTADQLSSKIGGKYKVKKDLRRKKI